MDHDLDTLWQMLQDSPLDVDDDDAVEEPEMPDDVADLLAEMNSAEEEPAVNGVDYSRAEPITEYMATLDEATLAHIAIRVYDMVRNRTSTWHQRRLHEWVDNHPILLDRRPAARLSEKTLDYYTNLDN